jgi:sugar lactone lactonase YvrE
VTPSAQAKTGRLYVLLTCRVTVRFGTMHPLGRLSLVFMLVVAASSTTPDARAPVRQVADFGPTTLRYGRGFQAGYLVGNGIAAMLNKPCGMLVTPSGDLLVADSSNNVLRRVPAGTDNVQLFAGQPAVSLCSLGSTTTAFLVNPTALLAHPLNPDIVFISDSARISVLSQQSKAIDLFAGQCMNPGYRDGPAVNSQFSSVIVQMAYDITSSTLFIADYENHAVRKIWRGDTSLVSGTQDAGVVDGIGSQARHDLPAGLVFVASNADGPTLVVSEHNGHVLRSIDLATEQVTTIAGQPYAVGYRDGAATDALFFTPAGLAVDCNVTQAIYVADGSNHVVRRLTRGPLAWVTTIVGNGKMTFINSGTSHLASIANPVSLFIDGATGRLYISGESGIVTVDLSLTSGAIPPTSESIGIVSVLAGSGTSSYADGPALSAAFNTPRGLQVSPLDDNVLLIADSANRVVRQLHLATMQVTTIIGSEGNSVGKDGIGTAAQASSPLCFTPHPDQPNVVFFTDTSSVRSIVLSSLTVSTLSGSAASAPGYMDGAAAQSQFDRPHQMLIAILRRSLYVADTNNNRIRIVDIDTGGCATAAGDGTSATVDGGGIGASFAGPYGLAFVTSTITIVSDRDGHGLRSFDIGTLQVTTLTTPTASGAYLDGPVAQSQFSLPQQLVTGPAGRFVFIADSGNHVVRRLDFLTGWVATVMGPGSGGVGVLSGSVDSSLETSMQRPSGLAFSCRGGSLTLFVSGNHGVLAIEISATQNLLMNKNCTPLSLNIGAFTLVAGSNVSGTADNLVWGSARFNGPAGISVLHSRDGDAVLVADRSNHAIRRISFTVGVSTFAGTLTIAGDDTTHLTSPSAIIAVPQAPDTYLILTAVGVRELVGTAISPYCGATSTGYQEGEPSVSQFNNPQGFDSHPTTSDLIVADTNNFRVRVISSTTRSSSLVAGQSTSGATDGPAISATFGAPTSIVYNKDGTRAIVADTSNHMLREIVFGTFTNVMILAGSIAGGFADGPCSKAKFNAPSGLGYDPTYTYLYVADRNNHRIRRVDLAAGRVVTVVGNGLAMFLSSTASHEASVKLPEAVAIVCTWGVMTLYVSSKHQVSRVVMSNTDEGCAPQSPVAYDIGLTSVLSGSSNAGSGGITFAAATYQDPTGIISIADGTLLMLDTTNNVIRLLDLPNKLVSDWVGASGASGPDDGVGMRARLRIPVSIAKSPADDDTLYLADATWVRNIAISALLTSVVCGSTVSDIVDGACSSAQFRSLRGLAIDPYSHDVYVTDANMIRSIAAKDAGAKFATSLCGRSDSGYNDGVGTAAQFDGPEGIAVLRGQERLLVADVGNHCLREIDLTTAEGYSTTACGHVGYVDGSFERARFNRPRDVRRGPGTNSPYFFVTDSDNMRVRRVDFTGRRVATVVGYGTTAIFAPSSSSLAASIRTPTQLGFACYLGKQNLFVSAPHAILQLTLNSASIGSSDAVASNLCRSTSVDLGRVGYPFGQLTSTNGAADGIGRDASFAQPSAVLVSRVDPGTLYVADHGNYAIRRLDTTTLQVTTFLGVLSTLQAADDFLSEPTFLLHSPVDPELTYLCDRTSIRTFSESTGVVATVAGKLNHGMTDDVNPLAQFFMPIGLAVHAETDRLFVCDSGNNRVRAVGLTVTSTYSGSASVGRVDGPGSAALHNIPTGIVLLPFGSAYMWVTDRGSSAIRQVNILARYVTSIGGYSAGNRDGPLSGASFRNPMNLRLDPKLAYVYVADMGNHAIRRIHIASLFVQTVFGNGLDGFVASTSSLVAGTASPTDIAFACNDGTPRLYVTGINGVASVQLDNVAEEEGTVDWCAPYSTNIGRVTPVAIGSSLSGFTNSPVTFRFPKGLLISPRDSNILLVADTGNSAIRLVHLVNNTVLTLAGTNVGGHADGYGTDVRFNAPCLLVAHASEADYVFVGDTITVRMLQLSTAYVRTYAGSGVSGYFEASPATSATFSSIVGMDVNTANNDMFVTDTATYLRAIRFNQSNPYTERVSGDGTIGHTDAIGPLAKHDQPTGVVILIAQGAAWVADTGSHTLRAVNLTTYRVTTIGGWPYVAGHRDGTLANAQFSSPSVLSSRPSRDYVYLVSQGNLASIRRVRLSSLWVDTVLGGSGAGPTIGTPRSIDATLTNSRAAYLAAGCFLGSPTLFLTTEHSIAIISLNGDASDEERSVCTPHEVDIGPVKVLAGGAEPGNATGSGGDGSLNAPNVAMRSRLVEGRVVVSDVMNSVIRLVNELTGKTSTWIGRIGQAAATDGTETSATVAYARDFVDHPDLSVPKLYFSHRFGVSQIACAPFAPCTVTAICGGTSGTGYAEGSGSRARFAYVRAIDVDPDTLTLYVADTNNNRLRGVRPLTNGGYGSFLVSGSGAATTADGVGAAASHNRPVAAVVLPAQLHGDHLVLWSTDINSHCLRVVNLATQHATTASQPLEPGCRDGPLPQAQFSSPSYLKPDPRNVHLYLGDSGNRRVRRIHLASQFVTTVVGGDRERTGTFADSYSSLLGRVHVTSATPACRSSDGKPVLYLAGNHAVVEVTVDDPAEGFDCSYRTASPTHRHSTTRLVTLHSTSATVRTTTASRSSVSTRTLPPTVTQSGAQSTLSSSISHTRSPPPHRHLSSTPSFGVVTQTSSLSRTRRALRPVPSLRASSTRTPANAAMATTTPSLKNAISPTATTSVSAPPRAASHTTWSTTVTTGVSDSISASLTLLPPVPAVVAVPYRTPPVARTADYTATGTTVVLGVMSPSVASLAGRQSALRGLLSCTAREEAQGLNDVEPPGRDTNVLQLAVSVSSGQSAALDLRAGAIVMCAIELVAVAILGALVAAGRFAVHASKATGHYRTTGARWLGSLAWSRFPGSLAFAYAYTSGIATQSATVLLTNGTEPTAVGLLVGLASFIVVVPWAAAVALFARRFRRTFAPAVSKNINANERQSPSAFVRTYRWWLEPTCEWEPSAELMSMQDTKRGYNLQRHFGLVFDPYNSRAPWFVILEVMLLNVVAGVASQLATAAGCAWATWLTFAVYMVHIAAMAWFRPYSVRLEALGQTVVVTSQCLAVMLAGAKSEGAEGTLDSASSVAEAIATVAAFVLMLLPLLSVYHTIRSFVRQRVELVARTSHAERLLTMPDADDILAPALVFSDFTPNSNEGHSVVAGTSAIPRRSQFCTALDAASDVGPDLDALLGEMDKDALPEPTAPAASALVLRDQYGAVLNLATTGGRTTVNPLLIRTPEVQVRTPSPPPPPSRSTLDDDLDALLGP